MTGTEIKDAFNRVTSRHQLLFLLNSIKIEGQRGDRCYAFTLKQLNYFCNSSNNSSRYRIFNIPKKNGGIRKICSPQFMLKSMLSCLNVLLQEIYSPSDSVTGFTKGRSVVGNASKHTGKLYVFNSDLKDFFPSISKPRVRAALMAKPICANKDIADAIANICCVRLPFLNGEIVSSADISLKRELPSEDSLKNDIVSYKDFLPQGSPASPAMTNIVCRHMDWQMEHLARKFKCTYSRYADDMTFSCNRSIFSKDGDFYREFSRIVQENGFSLNEKKTRVLKKGCRQEVTGLTVGDKVNVPKSYVREITNILHIWGKYGYKDAVAKYSVRHPQMPFSGKEGNCVNFENILAGKLNYLKMVKGETDPVYNKLKEKFDSLSKEKSLLYSERFIYSKILKIPNFERLMNCTIHFHHKKLLLFDGYSKEWHYAEMTIFGRQLRAMFGHNTIMRWSKRYSTNLLEYLEVMKDKLFISCCYNTWRRDEFWLITDYKPFCNPSYVGKTFLLLDDSDIDDLPEPDDRRYSLLNCNFNL